MGTECRLCPNACGADRELSDGACRAGREMRIAKYGLHPYEEPVISGTNGAGNIFFSGCSLRCVFCQNYEVSRAKLGRSVSPR